MGFVSNLTKENNSYFVINDKNLYRTQRKVLQFSGLDIDKDIKFYEVKVGEHAGADVTMHSLVIGAEDYGKKPIAVFLHGYAAAGTLY